VRYTSPPGSVWVRFVFARPFRAVPGGPGGSPGPPGTLGGGVTLIVNFGALRLGASENLRGRLTHRGTADLWNP